jgi:hypothetical protein
LRSQKRKETKSSKFCSRLLDSFSIVPDHARLEAVGVRTLLVPLRLEFFVDARWALLNLCSAFRPRNFLALTTPKMKGQCGIRWSGP